MLLVLISTEDLSPASSGPRTDTGVVWVAMLSMLYKNWGKLCVMRGIVLPHYVIYIRWCAPIQTSVYRSLFANQYTIQECGKLTNSPRLHEAD